MKTNVMRLARRGVLCGVASALACASIVAGTTDDAARQKARRQFMLEQLRQFQLLQQAKSGRYVPPALDAHGLPVAPANTASVAFRPAAGLVRQPAIPTAEIQFQSLVKKTYDKLLLGPGGCCLCSTAAFCDDSLFCDGAEICQSGQCAPGTNPCVDGDPCTNDLCTETTDTCSHPAVPPPAEVASLNVARSGLPSVTTLAWSSVSGATAYNVYRGAASTLGDLACFAPGVTGTSSTDLATPVHAFFYLVTSTACGESTLGNGRPSPRPPPPGCP